MSISSSQRNREKGRSKNDFAFCTRFCENETNLKVIQDIMGHADITTTMNIYAEATKEKKQQAMANLNGKIKIM